MKKEGISRGKVAESCREEGKTKMGFEEEIDSGHARLHELGYKQELKRDLS